MITHSTLNWSLIKFLWLIEREIELLVRSISKKSISTLRITKSWNDENLMKSKRMIVQKFCFRHFNDIYDFLENFSFSQQFFHNFKFSINMFIYFLISHFFRELWIHFQTRFDSSFRLWFVDKKRKYHLKRSNNMINVKILTMFIEMFWWIEQSSKYWYQSNKNDNNKRQQQISSNFTQNFNKRRKYCDFLNVSNNDEHLSKINLQIFYVFMNWMFDNNHINKVSTMRKIYEKVQMFYKWTFARFIDSIINNAIYNVNVIQFERLMQYWFDIDVIHH